ncbi:MAG: hypothetical protein IJW59_02910 [Clostridia bacterium]|nr:hypothetical protein [Clostridia bacterium]
MKVQEKLKINFKGIKNNFKFQVIILITNTSSKSFKKEILGRGFVDWIAFACEGLDVKAKKYNDENILEFVKSQADDSFDYTIVLLDNIPLITKDTITNICEYCKYKNIQLCKLPVGYVFNNEYLSKAETPQVDSVYSQDLESFYIVENKKQFKFAEDVLQDRVNSFHISNGVEIKKPSSVYIEPEVDIDKGVVIYPNNSLKGKTVISQNVILKENNVIEQSKIGKECCLSGSVVEGSILANGVYVSSFCEIKNSLVGENCLIGSSCKIYNYHLTAGSKLKANEVLGEEDDSNNRVGESRKDL